MSTLKMPKVDKKILRDKDKIIRDISAFTSKQNILSENEELKAKRDLADKQRKRLVREINAFLIAAFKGDVCIRDEKIKMYTNTNVSSSANINKLGDAISELAFRNIKLWHCEDEVRRTDLADAEIVKIKRRIDTTNQERNDLMDKVDEILQKESEV